MSPRRSKQTRTYLHIAAIDVPIRPGATVINLGHFRAQQEKSPPPGRGLDHPPQFALGIHPVGHQSQEPVGQDLPRPPNDLWMAFGLRRRHQSIRDQHRPISSARTTAITHNHRRHTHVYDAAAGPAKRSDRRHWNDRL
jgi:hypothetical protein